MALVYSAASEAAKKQAIDAKISSSSVAIDMHDEDYLKELIAEASGGKKTVSAKAAKLQFFIVKGGAEGFLDHSYSGRDASRVLEVGTTTDGGLGSIMIFDYNDLIAVFDGKGNLISSALLQRPISIRNPNIWTEATANKVYDAWDGQPVSLYFNRNFDIQYFGLWINDKVGYYQKGWVRIDIHKQEATNGCIFIVPPKGEKTPELDKPHLLNAFEPKFIVDVQKAVGKNIKSNIGTMHMIKIG